MIMAQCCLQQSRLLQVNPVVRSVRSAVGGGVSVVVSSARCRLGEVGPSLPSSTLQVVCSTSCSVQDFIRCSCGYRRCAVVPTGLESTRGCRKSLTMAASVQSSEAPAKETEKSFVPPSGRTPLEMTYLEGNSWLWTFYGMNILVDPVLVGNLDFGIPLLYDAAKMSKIMKKFTLDDLPKLDCILITQGFDDHCHKRTLKAMVEKFSEVRVIASPNAESIMGKIGYHNVTYLEPRDITMLGGIRIRATEGPVLGPPWQRPENGYFLEVPDPKFVLYYEPHCIYGKASLDKERADVIITPVNKLVLPLYTLVSGQEDAVKLAKFLQPRYLVTMKNAELESRGVLSMIVSEKGTVDSFKEMLDKEVPGVEVLEPEPGVPFEVPILSMVSSK